MRKIDQFLIAEYCPGPFFWGWHLYLRDRNDGSRNDDGGWGWLKRSYWTSRCIAEFLSNLECPDAKAFATKYPKGMRVVIEDDAVTSHRICISRPPQRKGAIRTIRGAYLADLATERRDRKASRELDRL